MIDFKEETEIDLKEILYLYNNANWTNYTKSPEKLKKAFQNSGLIITARKEGKLIGLIRVVTDKETIVYIQDVLVLQHFQRNGIGSQLINLVLKKYKHIRQIVLMTDDTGTTKNFYESLGFSNCQNKKLLSYIKINS